MIIQTNMQAMFAQNQYRINTQMKEKSTGRLSSGYRINQAADDAASLSISEKMRSMIRGLNQGSANCQEGVNWIRTGDGALDEVTAMMHRMKELAVHSMNGTVTKQDRAALQLEFDSLQSEIDRISGATEYNTQNVFEGHEATYHTILGNRIWEQSQKHTIVTGNNTLTIQTVKKEGDPANFSTITVPPGTYTTQELMDEIDDAFGVLGQDGWELNVEFTGDGMCNLNYEGGENIQGLSGSLSYLFYDTYDRGSMGALLGTTQFENNSPLIITSANDEMQFTLQDYGGNTKEVKIKIPEGMYSRQEMIDCLNGQLGGTGVAASTYGDKCIQIFGEDFVVTGLKGDMFKIDDPLTGQVYSSVFYDNTKSGTVRDTNASLVGGAVIPENTLDTDFNHFKIGDTNNKLYVRANGKETDPYIEITIPNGTYTPNGMAAQLNSLFAAAGLNTELNATTHSETVGTSKFWGLTITSLEAGTDSKIEFKQPESTAYDTLFRKKTYAGLSNVSPTDGMYTYNRPSITGGLSLSFPLTLDNTNNQFKLNVRENGQTLSDSYTIVLDAKIYADKDALQAELDKQLNGSGAMAGYKDKFDVSINSNNQIVIAAKNTSTVVAVNTSAASGDGFHTLFKGTRISYTETSVTDSGTASTKPSISLTFPSGTETIDASNNSFVVKVDGKDFTVTLPSGPIIGNEQKIADAITAQLPGLEVKSDKSFNLFKQGSSYADSDNSSASDNPTIFHCTAQGTGIPPEGTTTPPVQTPASFTIPKDLPSAIQFGATNNSFTCTVNNKTVTLTLEGNHTSRDSIAAEIQKQFDKQFTSQFNGVNVTLDGNRLKITTKLQGQSASLAFTNTSGSFMTALCNNPTAASVTLDNLSLNSTITIDSSKNNQEFKFQLNGSTQTLTLSKGTYTPNTLIVEINKQLENGGIAVTASQSSGSLRLTTQNIGAGNSLGINTATLGSCADTLYTLGTSPSITVPYDLLDSMVINSTNNKFSCQVDGVTKNITLDANTYTRSELMTELQTKLGSGVKVTLNGNKLQLASVKKGSSASIGMSSSSGATSFPALFGQDITKYSAVTASVVNGKLVLEGGDVGQLKHLSVSSISGASVANNLFLSPVPNPPVDIPPTTVTGSLISKYAAIDGKNIGETITINEYNCDLKFKYGDYPGHPGTGISISLTKGQAYTQEELQNALQDAIDASAVGTGNLKVTVDDNGVVIKAENPGKEYNMHDFSGGFYKYVLAGSTINTSYEFDSLKNGAQLVDPAYIIGRQDIKNNAVEIRQGTNDKLSLDLNIEGIVHKLEMTLEGGTYQGNSLIVQIQKQLNKALAANGFEENMIEANIGGLNSGVYGSNDNNALNFKLSKNMNHKDVGKYTVDGVGGSASFYVFYKTEGVPIPTYVEGGKDISAGVMFNDKNNTLSFSADGTTHNITFPYTGTEQFYTPEDIIKEINDQLQAEVPQPPLIALYENNHLKLSFTKFGKHTLDSISGLAKSDLFYIEKGRIDGDTSIDIQLTGNPEDIMNIDKPKVSTTALGINSSSVSQVKYASKALARIDAALNKLLESRSSYGAKENRLDSTKRTNDNTSENTQSAESKLRDANLAAEGIALAKSNILGQVIEAMMTQANSSSSGILKLLQ